MPPYKTSAGGDRGGYGCCGGKAIDIIRPKSKASQKHAMFPKTVCAAACPKIDKSIAVVKDSDDPYRDFQRSMLEMIREREIHTWDDLRHLLDCFLQLNSPRDREIIVRAFDEISNGGGDAAAYESPVVRAFDGISKDGGDAVAYESLVVPASM